MKKHQLLSIPILTVLFCIGSCKKADFRVDKGLAITKSYSGKVATTWFKLFADISRTSPYNPPVTSRFLAYSGLTLYESVAPGSPSLQSVFQYLTGTELEFDKKKEVYWPACANAALARIASKLMQTYPSPRLPAIDSLETLFNITYQVFVLPEVLANSNEFGRYVADQVFEWSKTDGTLNQNGSFAVCGAYVPLGGDGNWVPTPPGFLPAAGVCQGSLRTFVKGIATSTLPPAPPAYSVDLNSDFFKMNKEIVDISLHLTDDDKNISQAWRDLFGTNYNTPAHMIRLTSQILEKENKNLEESANIYGQQCMAMFDAIVSNFYAKFEYALLRPVTYINGAMNLPGWTALYPSPQHPSYPAVAPDAAAAAVVALEQEFGPHYSFIDSTQNSLYGSRKYASFQGLLDDVGRSRTHAGLNFKLAVGEGMKQGRAVGAKINMVLSNGTKY